ncbi:MAG: PAS domain-containing protein [Micavibrio sp.]|nr:PAS domain-containing protein [Micavibrio sp.]
MKKNKRLAYSYEAFAAEQDQSIQKHADPARPEIAKFMELSRELFVLTDERGQILWTNKAFNSISGYQKEDLSGLHFLDLFESQDKPFIRNSLLELSGSLGDQDFPLMEYDGRIVTKDGGFCHIEWRQQLHNGILYCAGRDISATKVQEGALSRREKQLIEAESIAKMGHWHWTIGEEVMGWSDQIYTIFGVERQAFIPTFDSLNAFVEREDMARVNQAFQRALIEENDYDMDFRIHNLSGEMRYIRCEGRCGRDADGEVIALYGIMQDMTERMLYEGELKKAKEAAERSYVAKTQFLANMSHELRTPLNAIIGFSEMIEQQLLGPIGTEKYLDYIGGIRESGTHLLDLISDILDMSKIEAGKYDLDLEDLSISKSLKLAVHMMEGRAHDAGVRVSLEGVPDDDYRIVADRRAVLQVLLNLLSNAVKFTPKGGSVTLSCESGDASIFIKVKDTGIGIPSYKLKTITKPFEQISSSYARDHAGTGLGLAITKELIEMHGGNLAIESTVDVGTTVSVRLPHRAKVRIKNKS